MRIFPTDTMYEVPKFNTMFRVGPYIGKCILSTPWFVVMWED